MDRKPGINNMKKSFLNNLKNKVRPYFYHTRHILSGRKNIISKYDFTILGNSGNDSFFGYYDVSPFCPYDDNILTYMSVNYDKSEASIHLYNINSGQDRIIDHSKSWNWQQGCRLRWFPDEKPLLLFNDFDGENYCARVIDTKGNTIKMFSKPLYDIDCKAKLGITTDFSKLGYLRPGYGYTITPQKNYYQTDIAIEIVDLDNDTITKEISYSQVIDILGGKSKSVKNYYINHLSFAPNGNKFLFFVIEIIDKFHKASLLVYDLNNDTMKVLERDMKVSHYVWIDDETIICTAYDKLYCCNYYSYHCTDNRREKLYPNTLSEDGHPRLLNNGIMLTDTYPDALGYQHLFTVNLHTGFREEISAIYSTPFMTGEKRTDLHPRINNNNNKICIDSNSQGKRKIIIYSYE